MKRSIYPKLLKWKESKDRKPLLLYGARQVGKTYLLKEFGQKEFSEFFYFNCDKNQPLNNLFEGDYNIARIIEGLSLLANTKINPENSLIFFDEVQEIPQIVTSLKYFCENAPQFHVVAAGSLLGVNDLKGYSFPVGKVEILHLYPMNFIEFLWALGEETKAQTLFAVDSHELINNISPLYIELLRKYYYVGGMPEAVLKYSETQDVDIVRSIQNSILTGYYADIAKNAGPQAQRCRLVLDNIPSQLAKENKKFIYGAIKKGARAKDFEIAIQWLVDAGLVYKINRITKPDLPLKFYTDIDAFKLFLLDVGLLGALLDVNASQVMISDNIFSEYKGAFTENYVANQIISAGFNGNISYYSKENSTIEIDFILQLGDKLVPIEVKAEENVRSKSLRQFITVDKADKNLKGVRFSMKGYDDQVWMENIPLFAIIPYLQQI